ncbi:MAG: MFS transporter, partial [Nitrospirales bacterium]
VVSSSSAALVADLSARQVLGAGLGLQGTVADLGHASGPLLAGVLIALLSYIHAFAVIATIQILAGSVFWVGVKRWQRSA